MKKKQINDDEREYLETGHKYIGFEIDEQYYRLAKERLERETAQMNFFNMGYELC